MRTPVQTLLTGYKSDPGKGENDGPVYTKIFEQEINYFNYRSLYYGKTYLDAFDVRDCVPEPDDRRYFSLWFKEDSKSSFA